MKILNLGEDGQDRTGAVAAALQSTDDDPVDPHLERIKNQAGDEESDEEVLCVCNLCSSLPILSWSRMRNLFACKSYCNLFQLQDEDFVADKDDSGSPSDDSEEGSDASISDGEKEVTKFTLTVSLRKLA